MAGRVEILRAGASSRAPWPRAGRRIEIRDGSTTDGRAPRRSCQAEKRPAASFAPLSHLLVDSARAGSPSRRSRKGVHDYLPDFIVRVRAEPVLHLILETKGFDPLEEVKTAAARRWVAAVNAEGTRGRWAYSLVKRVVDVGAAVAAASAHGARG
jgi:hypothetical protein